MKKDAEFYKKLFNELSLTDVFGEKTPLSYNIVPDVKIIKDCEEGRLTLTEKDWFDLYEKSKNDRNLAYILFSSPKLPRSILTEDIKSDEPVLTLAYMSDETIKAVLPLLSTDEFERLLNLNSSMLFRLVYFCDEQEYKNFTQEQIKVMTKLYFKVAEETNASISYHLLAFVNDFDYIQEFIKNEENKMINEDRVSSLHVEELKTIVANSYVLTDEQKNIFDVSEIDIQNLTNPTTKTFDDAYQLVMASGNKKHIAIFLENAFTHNLLTEAYQLDAMLQFVNKNDKKKDEFLRGFILRVKDEAVFDAVFKLPAINRDVVYDNPCCPALFHQKRIEKLCKQITKQEFPPHNSIAGIISSIDKTDLSDKTYDTVLEIAKKELDLPYAVINSPYVPERILKEIQAYGKKDMEDMDLNLYGRQEGGVINFFATLKLKARNLGLKNVDEVCKMFYDVRYNRALDCDFRHIAENPDIEKYLKIINELSNKQDNSRLNYYVKDFKNGLHNAIVCKTPPNSKDLSKLTTEEFDIFLSQYKYNLKFLLYMYRDSYFKLIDKEDEINDVINVCLEKKQLKEFFESIGR